MFELSNILEVYTDGSAQLSSQRGGWAFIVVVQDQVVYESFGKDYPTTNNRMEMLAMINALKIVMNKVSKYDEIKIFSDSNLVVTGYNSWVFSWIKSNWVKSNRKPVENKDLWLILHELRHPKITLHWVRGHNGHKYNEHVDKLTRNYME